MLDHITIMEIRNVVAKTLGTAASFVSALAAALTTPPAIGSTTPAAGTFTTLKGATGRFGSGTNYSDFDATGHLTMVGDAKPWRDELGDITTIKTIGPGVSLNTTEGALEFVAAANLSDYAIVNTQCNHDKDPASKIFPHAHCWLDQQSVVPNLLVQYRIQDNAAAKTTAWTNYKLNTLLTTAPGAGVTGNAILGNTTGITVPTGLSTIVQMRLLRDSANASTVFAGADPFSGTFSVTMFDSHLQMSSLGSTDEYTK